LAQLLQVEKVKADRARDKLIQRISGLLGEYTEARDQSLREAVSSMRQNVSAEEIAIGQFLDAHTGQLEVGVKRRRDRDASLDKRGTDGKEAQDISIKVLSWIAYI
jgi:kinesin family member 11